MKPNNVEGDLSFATKVKIVGMMTLLVGVLLASAVGYTSYQRNAKAEAVKLAATQAANLKAIKTSFPLYRETKEFKEIASMAITKVNQSELPKTITGDLVSSSCVDQSIAATNGTGFIGYGIRPLGGGAWIYLYTEDMGAAPTSWSVTSGGSILVPSAMSAGKYEAVYDDPNGCDVGGGVMTGTTESIYQFKIVPPCPTVTLNATVTPIG